jgi:hypothetical protein
MTEQNNIHKTNVDKIKLEIHEMLDVLSTNVLKSEIVLKKRFAYLHTTSPALFTFILKNHNSDKDAFYKNINMMLDLIKDIQNSKISQYDASAVVGQKIGEQYIPQLKK